MANIEFLAKNIESRYGKVKRARSCFLYTAKGVRLTDMYQENGRAILGWGGGAAFTVFKNVLNRGATGSFITDESYRIVKAVETLFNSKREAFYFTNQKEALKAAILLSPSGTNVYRPWSPVATDWSEKDCIIFEPPLPIAGPLFILAAKKEIVEKAFSSGVLFKSDLVLYSALQAAVSRAIYDLIKALQERKESDWFVYDKVITKYWERKGPYLFSKISQEKYESFVIHCLDLGIVINPDFYLPSIVPFKADEGVFTKLKNNPFDF